MGVGGWQQVRTDGVRTQGEPAAQRCCASVWWRGVAAHVDAWRCCDLAAVGGNSAGRPPSNITDAMLGRTPAGTLKAGEVTYRPGFHNWKAGAPAGTKGCASMEVASGRWVDSPCAEKHAVVCCTPPTLDQFPCSQGIIDDSKDWPIVPFYYYDDKAANDIPDRIEDVAKGFRHRNAYFVGNAALSNMWLDEAELCLEDVAANKRLCALLYPRTLDEGLLVGGGLDGLTGSGTASTATPQHPLLLHTLRDTPTLCACNRAAVPCGYNGLVHKVTQSRRTPKPPPVLLHAV